MGGDLYFHEGYRENPLVNAMCLGLLREEHLKRSRASLGRPIYYAGAKTGRDGIGGAAFASRELKEEKAEDRPAVRWGTPSWASSSWRPPSGHRAGPGGRRPGHGGGGAHQ